jgi:hypothetical protein
MEAAWRMYGGTKDAIVTSDQRGRTLGEVGLSPTLRLQGQS